MKNNIELYFEEQLVDTNDVVTFAITKQFKDVTNPTDIINSWTKTITLPFTSNNNKLFGNIFNTQRTLSTSGNSNIGLNFDPTKKIEFQLLYNSSLVMSGYAKMTSIEKGKGYTINLYGELGKVFSELKKLTPTLTDEITDPKYLINPIEADGFYINAENVAKCWTLGRDPSNPDVFRSKIGFVPVNDAYDDEFQSDMVYTRDPATGNEFFANFTDILGSQYDDSIYTPEAIIGDGLLPREFSEYRSYNLQPYIYTDSLFNELLFKARQITDYTIILDENWFTFDNPYYGNSVMLLKNLDHTVQNQETQATFATMNGNWMTWTQQQLNNLGSRRMVFQSLPNYIENNEIICVTKELAVNAKYLYDFRIQLGGYIPTYSLRQADNSAIFVYFTFEDVNDPTRFLRTTPYIIVGDNDNIDKYKLQGTVIKSTDSFGFNLQINGSMPLQFFELGSRIKASVQVQIIPNSAGNIVRDTRARGAGDGEILQSGVQLQIGIIENNSTLNLEISGKTNRSNDWITFNDLWDNEISFFDIILNYTKMFNLIWDIDIFNKTINIKRQQDYFKEYKDDIEDWTNKIDYAKDFKMEPLIFDKKYYRFGYQPNESIIGQTYKQQYGSEYCDLLINTNYNFNDEVNDLLPELQTSIVSTSNIMSWGNIIKGNVFYQQCQEPMLCLGDKDHKRINAFGSFLFYRGIKQFTFTDGRDVRLTDDNIQMKQINKFCYSEGGVIVDHYPYLDVIDFTHEEKLMHYFGVPKLCYDSTENYRDTTGIYEYCWRNFIEEITRPDNFKLTCYVKLSDVYFVNFKHNKLVMINNVLYLVNKIIDFNFGQALTKVELIKLTYPNKLWT